MKLGAVAFFCVMCCGPVAAVSRTQAIDLQAVSARVARQHLQDLAAILERYYPYLKTKQERARFESRVMHLDGAIRGPIPIWREWLVQEELIRTLNDPHAELGMDMLEDRALEVKLHWVSNGLLVSPARWMHPALFPVNSEVVSIGGKTPGEILPRLERLFAGTPGWVADWPGSMLRYAFELRWLGLMHGERPVTLILRTPGGQLRHLQLAVAPLPESKTLVRRGRQKPWFSWFVDKTHNVASFSLDSMKLTGPYEHAVVRFFAAVKKAGITRVAVDLRQNGGGESLAEAPFMQYLGVTKVRDYSSYIYFEPGPLRKEVLQLVQELRKLGFAPAGYKIPIPPQPRSNQFFKGTFYVVTGPGTFSSAMDFAADVKFNHLGIVVGLPCGEILTGGGDVKRFAHPQSGVPFQVPTDLYRWPGLPLNALVEPDVTIPLTVQDLQDGVDPVRRWFDSRDRSGGAP